MWADAYNSSSNASTAISLAFKNKIKWECTEEYEGWIVRMNEEMSK